ncbi:hypothetical protein PAPYR_9347 [Paratrimastix pyriformis]|uniref:Uncharacterized protein n=1 Tax=Paratrimastix pyriformis TaxID=342808 RepID=A0ABQ8UBD1_9EUKA|nr:hypothetical protein PAPYR_9347 [Paratrimastix pyriformis]
MDTIEYRINSFINENSEKLHKAINIRNALRMNIWQLREITTVDILKRYVSNIYNKKASSTCLDIILSSLKDVIPKFQQRLNEYESAIDNATEVLDFIKDRQRYIDINTFSNTTIILDKYVQNYGGSDFDFNNGEIKLYWEKFFFRERIFDTNICWYEGRNYSSIKYEMTKDQLKKIKYDKKCKILRQKISHYYPVLTLSEDKPPHNNLQRIEFEEDLNLDILFDESEEDNEDD